jgi:hypothetical protein
MFQTHDGTQSRPFYIESGYDTYNHSYQQLYNRIVKELSHFFDFKLVGANIMIIFEAKIEIIELWESLQTYVWQVLWPFWPFPPARKKRKAM